ncbi:MAG: type II secretion system F family protein, partial [Oscillospiraceae bacterium]
MADKKLNYDEIAYFCEQLHMMLGAGMNLSDGMDIIAEGISGRLKDACAAVSEELN